MTNIVLGETTDHIIEIAPMIYNARILMTPKDAEGLYWDYGWCYRNIPEAVIAFNGLESPNRRRTHGMAQTTRQRRS